MRIFHIHDEDVHQNPLPVVHDLHLIRVNTQNHCQNMDHNKKQMTMYDKFLTIHDQHDRAQVNGEGLFVFSKTE